MCKNVFRCPSCGQEFNIKIVVPKTSRRAEMAKSFLDGNRYSDVAKNFGVTTNAARHAVHRELEHRNKDLYNSLREKYDHAPLIRGTPSIHNLRKNRKSFGF